METGGVAAHQDKTSRLGAQLVFVDESGFLLIPSVCKTWAQRGQTPLLYHRQRRDTPPRANPDEGVWKLAKQELANGPPDTQRKLWRHLQLSLNRIRRSRQRLRGCIRQSDLPPFRAGRDIINAGINKVRLGPPGLRRHGAIRRAEPTVPPLKTPTATAEEQSTMAGRFAGAEDPQ